MFKPIDQQVTLLIFARGRKYTVKPTIKHNSNPQVLLGEICQMSQNKLCCIVPVKSDHIFKQEEDAYSQTTKYVLHVTNV